MRSSWWCCVGGGLALSAYLPLWTPDLVSEATLPSCGGGVGVIFEEMWLVLSFRGTEAQGGVCLGAQ